PVEAADEIVLHWVARGCEDDRYRCGCGLGRNCRQGVVRSDHRHLTAYQIGCEVGESIILVLRPAILDRHTLAFDVPGFADALPECGHKTCSVGRRRAAEEPDHRHPRLLRPRRKRPRGRTAEQRDELATAAHSITSSARAMNVGVSSRPSALAVFKLTARSNFVASSTGSSAGLVPCKVTATTGRCLASLERRRRASLPSSTTSL